MNHRCLSIFSLIVLAFAFSLKAQAADEDERVKQSGIVLAEFLDMPSATLPPLLQRALCVVVIPAVWKGSFGVGGSYGRGVLTCRRGLVASGAWSAPAFYALEGASVGIPLGGRATDFFLLVMDSNAARSLLEGKVKLGSQVTTGAGPNSAATSPEPLPAILSYVRSKGQVGGISLSGSTLRSDTNADQKLYGRKLTARQIIVEGSVPIPPSGREMASTLDQKLPATR